jgi:hypothetical protein
MDAEVAEDAAQLVDHAFNRLYAVFAGQSGNRSSRQLSQAYEQ